MSQDYRLYLVDKLDWGYAETNVESQLRLCNQLINVDSATHPAYGLILVECRRAGEQTLRDLKARGVLWGSAYVQWLPNTGLVQYDEGANCRGRLVVGN